MRVLKFDGILLADAECFLRVINIIESNAYQEQVAVVLSSPVKVMNYWLSIIEKTVKGEKSSDDINHIENMFKKILKELNSIIFSFDYEQEQNIITSEFYHIKKMVKNIKLLKYCQDALKASILSSGERLCVSIMEMILKSLGHKVTMINPVEKLFAIGHHLECTIDISESFCRFIDDPIPREHIILMPACIAGNKHGELMLLGRNGSDYSATVLAACLRADFCEILTIKDGIYTCHEPEIPNVRVLKSISYEEAIEISYCGGKVLHPRTIAPLAQFQIPCTIKNFCHSKEVGTLISNKIQDINCIKSITSINDMVMFNISGPLIKEKVAILSRLLRVIERVNISIMLIKQSFSSKSIMFCTSQKVKTYLSSILEAEFNFELQNSLLNQFDILEDLTVISIISDGIRGMSTIVRKCFLALDKANIDILSFTCGYSEQSISLIVTNNDATTSIRIIHRILFVTSYFIELFILGVGGVGSALLHQLYKQKKQIKQQKIDLRVCVIANSRCILTNSDGINLHNWKIQLSQAQEQFCVDRLLNSVQEFNLINPVIVDCTSSQEIANQYVNFFSHGFHVVTPNKKANTASWKYYLQIRTASAKYRRKFLYDTNVGAGLPVIENFQNLLNAGDKLIKFSGVLSGSLSFIFGKLDEGISFSQATFMARKLGFTEPDPREDLSGSDVARKLLILIRETGHKLELNDINIEPILPDSLMKSSDVEEFMHRLSEIDNSFDLLVQQARNVGKVLRFVGFIDENFSCNVKIHAVDSDDPLYKVKNGENALAFYSRYYHPIPLVIRGYGAGNDVTAAGIFADLLRTLS